MKLFLHNSQKYKYNKCNSRAISIKNNLICSVYSDAYLIPVKKNDSNTLWGDGGVLDSTGTYVYDSGTYSRGGIFEWEGRIPTIEKYVGNKCSIPLKDYNYINEEIIYLGYIQNHWGHFLIDYSTKLWYIKKSKCTKMAFITNDSEKISLHENIFRFLELLGINRKELLFINKPTKFKKVIIPQSSYQSNDFYSKEYLDTFNEVIKNCNKNFKTYEKVYFTRNFFKKAEDTEIGEEMIMNTFKDNGYQILSPEKLSLDEQITIIQNAKKIVCISGTLAHNMLFAKPCTKLTILNKTYIMNLMQMDINYIKKLNVTYVDSYSTLLPEKLGDGPFLLQYNNILREYLTENKFKNIYNNNLIHKESIKNTKKYIKLYSKKYSQRNLKEIHDIYSVHNFEGPQCEKWQKKYITKLKLLIKINNIKIHIIKIFWKSYFFFLKIYHKTIKRYTPNKI